MEPEKDKKTTQSTGSETGTEDKGERLSPARLNIGAGGNGGYVIVQNINPSHERHHRTRLPGQGTMGECVTWGTKSTESW